MKKVLLITNIHSIFDEPIYNVFKSCGFDVQRIDFRGNVILMNGKFIHRAAAKLPDFVRNPLFNLAQWQVDLKILSTAKSYQPDLIFVIKAKNIHYSILRELKKIGEIANYYPETFDHWNGIRLIAPYYDYFFNHDPEIVKKLKEDGHQNAHYLPFSADVNFNETFPDFKQKKYDISFIGSFMPIRYAKREEILNKVKNLGFHVWGNKAWLATSLKDYYHGWAKTEEMLQIYRESKIVINIDLMASVGGTGVNLRPFEVTSCGAMLLNHNDRKDIFNLFEDGKEFVSFDGAEDILEKAKYYLAHQDKLEEIARAGFQKTLNTHTYAHRIKEAINIMTRQEI